MCAVICFCIPSFKSSLSLAKTNPSLSIRTKLDYAIRVPIIHSTTRPGRGSFAQPSPPIRYSHCRRAKEQRTSQFDKPHCLLGLCVRTHKVFVSFNPNHTYSILWYTSKAGGSIARQPEDVTSSRAESDARRSELIIW